MRYPTNAELSARNVHYAAALQDARHAVVRLAVTVRKLDKRGWQDKTVDAALKLAGVHIQSVYDVENGTVPWPGVKR